MGYWKNRAKDVILAVMRGALADGVSREEMLRRVDESYPFGPRKNYPYQAWLEVRKVRQNLIYFLTQHPTLDWHRYSVLS